MLAAFEGATLFVCLALAVSCGRTTALVGVFLVSVQLVPSFLLTRKLFPSATKTYPHVHYLQWPNIAYIRCH